MNPQYKAAREQAVRMQHKFRDMLDDKSQPVARTLENEIQRIVDEFEMNKNPRSIEERIKQLQRMLKDVDRGTPPVMDNRDADFLHDNFEHLRMSLRKFDNY